MSQIDLTHHIELPKISIITIVRNGCEFIEQTIKSVLSQRYDNIEYIVIDGGSTDGTVDIIKSYESKIAKWISEKDEGIADAFNKGLSFVTGDYVLFLNSDDSLANPDVVEIMAHKIIENKLPTLIYGDCDVLDRSSGRMMYRASIKFSPQGLKRGQMLPHPSLLIHRTYFEKYGLFDTRFKIAMDYELLLRGGLKERVVHVPLLVTCVRNSGMSTLNHKHVVDEIILALKKNKYISSKLAEFKMRRYFFMRSFAKSILDNIGLYKAFFYLRNRFQTPGC
jgi:glycosyltransferase involved in cell wall biosynthesis